MIPFTTVWKLFYKLTFNFKAYFNLCAIKLKYKVIFICKPSNKTILQYLKKELILHKEIYYSQHNREVHFKSNLHNIQKF